MPATYEPINLEESSIFNRDSSTLLAVKQLIFSKTRLEFRLLWNKIFQNDDEELGWLLNPYKKTKRDVNMMTSICTDGEATYRYNYADVSGSFAHENVTIYNRGVIRRSDLRENKEKKSFQENAIQIARYMGMGACMTSSAFPSPFMPTNDYCFKSDFDQYGVTKIW